MRFLSCLLAGLGCGLLCPDVATTTGATFIAMAVLNTLWDLTDAVRRLR